MRATAAERLRGEDGVAMVIVVFVSFLLMGLVVLVLGTGEQADRSSTRDRNYDLALSVAEAGVHEAVARIEDEAPDGTTPEPFTGSTAEGHFDVEVTRDVGSSYTIEARGTVGDGRLQRGRTVWVTLEPPESFPYALFSYTAIELKNLSHVAGDVWANDSVLVHQNNVVDGSVVAAQSWVDMREGSEVRDAVWSGGYNPGGQWAIRLANNAAIDGEAKASVSEPHDPTTCGGESQSDYGVPLGTGAVISSGLTTWGEKSGAGTVSGGYDPNTCTEAPVPLSMPEFTFNKNNYDPDTYHEFTGVSEFQTWLDANGSALEGTFYVQEDSPSQSEQVDLTGVTIVGDTTIVTNAPVFTNGVQDDTSTEKRFVLVSHYEPPTGTSCNVNQSSSECAIHIQNNFDPSCETAVLLYADNGPVSVKNNAVQCGAIYADSVLVKNDQQLTYDPRINRTVGFGEGTFEISRWEER